MRSEEKRLSALNDIRENIAKHGFHTYVVTGGGYPHFGYTIGLTESLGAELILAGKKAAGMLGECTVSLELCTAIFKLEQSGVPQEDKQ